jgi:hypothetical protein
MTSIRAASDRAYTRATCKKIARRLDAPVKSLTATLGLRASERLAAWVVVRVPVFAAASQYPGAFRYDVKESFARTLGRCARKGAEARGGLDARVSDAARVLLVPMAASGSTCRIDTLGRKVYQRRSQG